MPDDDAVDALARAGAFDQERLTDRAYQELIGIARGVLWDGHVTDEEIVRLHEWCAAYPAVYNTWPGDVLARRIRAALEDGYVEEHERTELKAILEDLTGGRDFHDRPTTLPLTDPAPELAVVGELFCLTGTFLFGSRQRCQEAVQTAGGIFSPRVTQKVHNLVIGHQITPAWVHSTHGRKIEQAVELRRRGFPIAIVSEELWSRAILRRLESLA